MWWEGTYQAVPFFHHGPVLTFWLHFSIQLLVFKALSRAPKKLRDLFVNPLLAKVASVRPKKKEHAGTSALPLWELLWVLLLKDSVIEDKKGDRLP